MMNEHQLRDLQLQLQLLHQSRRAAVTFARNLRLEQEKATFSDPADKRAVEFILDSQHDLEDFFDQIRHFVDEEGKVVRLRDSERDRLEGFISWCARYGNTRSKKLTREYEAYKVASKAGPGWGAGTHFRWGHRPLLVVASHGIVTRSEDSYHKEGDIAWCESQETKSSQVDPSKSKLKKRRGLSSGGGGAGDGVRRKKRVQSDPDYTYSDP